MTGGARNFAKGEGPGPSSAGAMLRLEGGPSAPRLAVSGRLDAPGVAALWGQVEKHVGSEARGRMVVDATGVEYVDGAGAALLFQMRRMAEESGITLELEGLREDFRSLLDKFDVEKYRSGSGAAAEQPGLLEEVGAGARQVWKDFLGVAEFIGEFSVALVFALRHPKTVRWGDALRTAETAGANALPVVLLVGFLIGFVMAFQAAIPMRQFGADVFIPSLVALAMFRELGPIMTALALAGRSSSAFAAELGTMKVNDEIAALTTMGLQPVRFLVVPRVLAAVLMTPVLTVFGSLAGLAGGWLVFVLLGYPSQTFFQQVTQFVGLTDFLGGMAKGFVFGVIVAGVGCLRGLQTRTGASAVGESTTSAVVSCIVLVAIGDGIFAIVYYALGI